MTVGAATEVSVQLGISSAPPPPTFVFQEEPRVVVVPRSTVYVVDDNRVDFDCFRYGVYWYIYNDGYWYRARSHRGPFRAIEVRYVPSAVVGVPPRHWKRHPNGGPPGLARRDGDVVVVKERGRGHRR
jgi:hypothetical protein